jgi:phospholipase/carboxylesterase
MSENTPPLPVGAALQDAAVACVFVHGRGQSPEAMQEQVLKRLAAPKVHFVLPRAATGSWYAAKAVDALKPSTRSELAVSVAGLHAIVKGLPAGLPLLLAGFSQGACLALEYAFAHGPWRGGLMCFTGCRVGKPGDERPSTDLNGLPVYLSGSDADPWIPVHAFAEAAAELAQRHARLRCDVVPDRQHEVSDVEVSVLQHALASLASGQEVLW